MITRITTISITVKIEQDDKVSRKPLDEDEALAALTKFVNAFEDLYRVGESREHVDSGPLE